MIKGISSMYRPQRSGKIHLGVKNVKQRADGTESSYPSEVDYFVLKDVPWLIPFYGEKPIELHITLPSARFEKENFEAYSNRVFPQFLKRYKKSGLMCKGDGEVANAVTLEGLAEIPCPCDFLDKGECKRMACLRLRVQEVPSFNVIQIDTSSFNSIVGINSFLRDLLEHCMVYGIDVSDVKLVLRRQETTTQRLEKGESKTSKHHVMVMDLDPRFYKSLDDVRRRALPQSQAPKPLELPPPTPPDVDEFYPDKETEPAEEAPLPPAKKEEPQKTKEAPLNPDDRLKAAVKEYELAKGIVSKAERLRLTKLTTPKAKENAAAYFESRTKSLKEIKGQEKLPV